MIGRRRARGMLAALAAMLCFGCGGGEPATIPVDLTVSIAAPGQVDPAATVHVSVRHAWSNTGELRYPLEIVESFETRLGSSDFRFDYPVELGEGLIVYAWIDADGDGANCTPAARGDLADLVEVAEFPSEQLSASLFLDAPCAGPDWFFPGPEPEMAQGAVGYTEFESARWPRGQWNDSGTDRHSGDGRRHPWQQCGVVDKSQQPRQQSGANGGHFVCDGLQGFTHGYSSRRLSAGKINLRFLRSGAARQRAP